MSAHSTARQRKTCPRAHITTPLLSDRPSNTIFMGATQFRLLTTLGLKEQHWLFDFGCGSLRVGRLLIPYLLPGRYYGLEPNRWLIEDGIAHELGSTIIDIKSGQRFGMMTTSRRPASAFSSILFLRNPFFPTPAAISSKKHFQTLETAYLKGD